GVSSTQPKGQNWPPRDPHGEQLRDHSRYSEGRYGRGRSHPRNSTGRGSETIGFIPGSADSVPSSRQSCGSCASMGWSSCKALICCVLTCGFYGTREPSVKTPGMSLEPNNKQPKTPRLPLNDSFRYPDVHIAGQKVKYPVADPKRGRASGKGDNQRPVSNTSLLSYEDYDLDEQSDKDIDSLITKKLLELYALHQIDQLAKCTSDSSFSRKTNEISELIYSIAQDYNLEEQEAECKLVHGVIRISTRKGKRNKGYLSTGQHHNSRRDGTLPDSGNETMTNTFMSSDFPEVKVSEQTPSDELARKMRNYSGRSECMRGGGVCGDFP
uniref:Keratinocyte differentiation factor 1a n=1 Tax=Neolamprologus brichardi TaxID=32507 RepID=A0A3Q4I6B7_NEOBR